MPDENYQPTPRRRNSLLSQLPLILALLIIICLLAIWKPWDNPVNNESRTISVTGEAEITAEPDEYIFNPQYNFKNADQKVALAEATAKTNEIVSELKKLGVADSKIKSGTSGYKSYYDDSQDTYYASLTVTVGDKARAQKVQDYLLGTTPTGSVTPQADFSQAKRKKLTDEARDKATREARHKAEQSARNLGFTVGKVKSVSDNIDNTIDVMPHTGRDVPAIAAGQDSAAPSSPIQQGEDKLTYRVTVVYYLR